MRLIVCGLIVIAIAVGCDSTSDPEPPPDPGEVPGRLDDPGLLLDRGDELGSAVAIDGTTMVVGAPGTDCVVDACDSEDPNDPGRLDNAGAVYVFEQTGGTFGLFAKLVAPVPARGDRFGASLALAGDTLIIGAPGDSNPLDSNGAVYVFLRSGSEWTPQP